MNTKYARRKTPLRRETDHVKGWYRTLFMSYLYRPPVWVYIVELAIAVLAGYILLDHNDEFISILVHLLSERPL